MNAIDIAKIAADEARAIKFFESLCWPNGPVCPRCEGREAIYDLGRTRPGLWKCGACRKQFTVRIGTIFEDSKLPFGKWLIAIHRMCTSKKGVSANQLSRELAITYKSAWHLCHRIRLAMTQEPLAGKLGRDGGIVEVDEVYIGGKPGNNLHAGKRRKPKPIVVTLIERGGDVRTVPVGDAKRGTLQRVVRQHVSETAHLMTDSASAYPGIDDYVSKHDAINHSREYVRGIIHTNFAESYHSLLKRGLFGTFHHISAKHLARYLREFEFRWNSRKATDGARLAEAISGADGKRLSYRPLTKALI